MRDVIFDISTAVAAPQTRCEAVLATRGLYFDAGGKRLIDGVDIGIRQGRRTMIMGANGAGKSLLLRLLHGLVAPTRGDVVWHGRPLDRAARQAQAMVFQRPVVLRRSVLANLRFALSARGIRGAERAAREAEALSRARLDHLARSPARVLSGGEQQRLTIARALACKPEMLLLDEPTASLDPASTQAIETLLTEAHRDGVTIVMVTHDAGQARRIGDDVIFLHDGRVVETGAVTRVLDAPQSDAASAWLGDRLYISRSAHSEI
ncbi:Tungstate uptake system ATP-binding protein TupC [Defluviimonas aquaemixtae]|uniref:Tungstate uptake system ATP-binding protein TupC n=1 Tax=Albidovulum aquaemixtae TaxID=1542388 RepID=A0A2R8BJW8_9RHOB|nr:ATP-binding cassette domain-containing protein [Defluviimonas aquaemixtae]SPH23701.1 Tungstate uptake system ATP-binding protein TupC [Defluviimonas aquaemixtae]